MRSVCLDYLLTEGVHILQIKITLKGIKPPIWRRVFVSEEMNLLEFHDLIQHTFGWKNYHLHIFKIAGMEFVNTSDWEEDAENYQDDRKARLGDLIPKFVPEGGYFSYVYDLGDGWHHEILVEKILPDDKQQKVPVVLAGKRACPPEDIGGTYGYQHFLEAIQDPTNPEHEDYLAWVGGVDFNPEIFDLEAVNQGLKGYIREIGLQRDSTWPKGPIYYNFSTTVVQSEWTKTLSDTHKTVAGQLPVRRDIVFMLKYLDEHSVKGTPARGNFPRKDIRGICAGFVDPPELDTQIVDRVWKLQTEDEVRLLMRYHLLACVAGLIYGGENLIWKLTDQGKVFLTLPKEQQVWYLSRVWFYTFNWYYEYGNDIELPSSTFKKQAIDQFLKYPVEEAIPIEQIIEDFKPIIGEYMQAPFSLSIEWKIQHFLERVVFDPLTPFGIFDLIKEQTPDEVFLNLVEIRLTPFGQNLLRHLSRFWER